MRFLFLIILLSCCRLGFAQNLLKELLQKDFADSRSQYSSWFAKDSVDANQRDTIIFYNSNSYYLRTKDSRVFLTWSFSSRATLHQSRYFPYRGHGLHYVTANDNYRFKLKEVGSKLFLKLINSQYQASWFEITRSLKSDSGSKEDYSVITLVLLPHKPS